MNLMNQIEYLKGILGVDMFDECSVPSALNMDRVRGAIVMRCGLLTPLYSEPEVQRSATQQFFYENQWNFNHLVKIISADYSPIENVFEDRTETELIGKNHSDSGEFSKSGNSTMATVTEAERKISAENVNSYSPDNQETETETETGTSSQSGTDSRSGNSSENRSTKMHRNGNIGVTSSQQLINEELDLIDRLNPYRFIADMYEKELMIGLY